MRRWLSLSLLVLAGFPGCGNAPKTPDTVPFTGVITMDGQPLEGAVVTFESMSQGGVSAFGVSNDKGEYQLAIMILNGKSTKEGAVPGDYKVIISRYVDAEGKRVKMNEPQAIPGKQSIPKRYSSAGDTLLSAKVDAKGGKQDFELKSKK